MCTVPVQGTAPERAPDAERGRGPGENVTEKLSRPSSHGVHAGVGADRGGMSSPQMGRPGLVHQSHNVQHHQQAPWRRPLTPQDVSKLCSSTLEEGVRSWRKPDVIGYTPAVAEPTAYPIHPRFLFAG